MERRNETELREKYPPHLERKKRSMMKRRKKIRVKRRAIVLLFLLVCVAIIVTVFKAPFFDIEKINCHGQGDMSVEDIVKMSGLAKGQNIFGAEVKDAEQKLMNHPEISKATVQRSFPDTIKIKIERAIPMAYVETDTKLLIIERNGSIIRTTTKEDHGMVENLLKVVGVGVVNEEPGKVFANDKDVRAKELFRSFGILEKNGMLEGISMMDFSDMSDLRFEYEKRIDILLGDCNNMEHKMSFARNVIFEQLSPHESAKMTYRGNEFVVGTRDEQPAEEEEVDSEEKLNEETDNQNGE